MDAMACLCVRVRACVRVCAHIFRLRITRTFNHMKVIESKRERVSASGQETKSSLS